MSYSKLRDSSKQFLISVSSILATTTLDPLLPDLGKGSFWRKPESNLKPFSKASFWRKPESYLIQFRCKAEVRPIQEVTHNKTLIHNMLNNKRRDK